MPKIQSAPLWQPKNFARSPKEGEMKKSSLLQIAILVLMAISFAPSPAAAGDGGEVLFTYLAHLADATVEVGDIVSAGQIVGHVGNTGYVNRSLANGNHHLHFAVRNIGPENTWCWDASCWLNPDNYLGTNGWLNSPVVGAGRCGSGFGEGNPLGGQIFHNAVDMACMSPGAEVLAVADGVVVWASPWPYADLWQGHGLTVVIRHGGSDLPKMPAPKNSQPGMVGGGLELPLAVQNAGNAWVDFLTQVKQGGIWPILALVLGILALSQFVANWKIRRGKGGQRWYSLRLKREFFWAILVLLGTSLVVKDPVKDKVIIHVMWVVIGVRGFFELSGRLWRGYLHMNAGEVRKLLADSQRRVRQEEIRQAVLIGPAVGLATYIWTITMGFVLVVGQVVAVNPAPFDKGRSLRLFPSNPTNPDAGLYAGVYGGIGGWGTLGMGSDAKSAANLAEEYADEVRGWYDGTVVPVVNPRMADDALAEELVRLCQERGCIVMIDLTPNQSIEAKIERYTKLGSNVWFDVDLEHGGSPTTAAEFNGWAAKYFQLREDYGYTNLGVFAFYDFRSDPWLMPSTEVVWEYKNGLVVPIFDGHCSGEQCKSSKWGATEKTLNNYSGAKATGLMEFIRRWGCGSPYGDCGFSTEEYWQEFKPLLLMSQ